MPSWTLQADPGPATGPFHWRSRELSIRELARLQTFPDDYQFSQSRRVAIRQVGNAVPPLLAEVIGLSLQGQVLGHHSPHAPTMAISARPRCPEPEAVAPVAAKYNALVGDHSAHPGTGKGPRALRAAAAKDETETDDSKEPT